MHFEEFKLLVYEFASTNLSKKISKKQTDISKLIFLPLHFSQHLTNLFISRPLQTNYLLKRTEIRCTLGITNIKVNFIDWVDPLNRIKAAILKVIIDFPFLLHNVYWVSLIIVAIYVGVNDMRVDFISVTNLVEGSRWWLHKNQLRLPVCFFCVHTSLRLNNLIRKAEHWLQ